MRFLTFFSLFVLLLGTSCRQMSQQNYIVAVDTKNLPKNFNNLGNAQNFAIQLGAQSGEAYLSDLERWAKSNADTFIMTRFENGDPVPKELLGKLSKGRHLLAYLNASHSQSFESYWQDNWGNRPPFAVVHNQEWDVWSVQQDHPMWQAAMRQALDHILEMGFDGVFLDDIVPYWTPNYPGERKELNQDTLDLLVMMRAHLQQRGRNNFVIVTNGGLETLDSTSHTTTGSKRFTQLVDAVLLESLSVTASSGHDEDRIDSVRSENIMRAGKRFRQESGKPVLGLNSTTGLNSLYWRSLRDMKSQGFLAYTAPGNYNDYREPR